MAKEKKEVETTNEEIKKDLSVVNTSLNTISDKEAESLFNSDLFDDGKGITVTAKILDVEEFWEKNIEKKMFFVAQSITESEDEDERVYKVVNGVIQTPDKKSFPCMIPQGMITNTISKFGLGAYTIKYLGTKKAKNSNNKYADFEIVLKGNF